MPGQGAIRQRKVITGISGSQTGPSGGAFTDLGIPELVQSGGAIAGASSSVNWPLNLPGTGSQDAVDLKIPVRGPVRRRAGANHENCWNARITHPHHSVARKSERDGSKSRMAGVISSRAHLDRTSGTDGKVQRACTWGLTETVMCSGPA